MDRPRILVVDDDPDILETLQFDLEQKGYQVFTACNGWEALGAAILMEPDLVLLDVMLPKENGYRVSRMIKENTGIGKLGKSIPVVLLTARNLEDDERQQKVVMEFSYAEDLIHKPFELNALVQRMEEILVGKPSKIQDEPPPPLGDP